ncbi:MAG: bifunctional lysylphosphatidylglycerol flippase/synthetase MprF [Lactobacillus sp.]|jgi:phosphatidylglycerol lysyltransferase|uniref:Bifunctional lysylphosphatidylglycerol flippase/synthetase MprF n=1 Tax=Lacticaseibacillus suilingensis TaxID=2799577 RepID=A0ABW4BII7_9LACO|nr:bifunctional lysylphosphatidylglycerol flippase/synthetase MprF [Lacticaseibacillus suilingensis]MCI1893684.1 bifunctional lysylphosphatidylglycerol flippase/synthetase MprF [Lactobacillus sp.]MCI1916767.1 bifunctional lysylphosphatidylglycerol flippase/synthetase MprF [Lactobacillus sp.]MCI1941319.1 bifunctional lysylphosphatidylglycerol flippase/synthetase MprF [Lactobacillus sp.]MCI1971863.1 bifunctional lysylphosphatidylglycerol flippase/synthetase MprF [Lactobacillus sp.]MCI2017085.1 b
MKKFGQSMVDGIRKHLTLLKVLFVLSVLVFVIIELGRIGRELSGAQMRASLASQSPQSLLAMAALGLVAVVPMLNYDFTITKMLPGDFKPLYVVRSGWVVNSFTNIAGFGGFLGASLRANYYHDKATNKQILVAISKIALFLLAGLSLWSILALLLIFGLGIGRMFSDYWIWLIGGAAYFPVLMVVTHLSNQRFFADMPIRRQLSLTLSSFLEWGGCALFFLAIGGFMQVPINLAHVLPLFMVANVLGVISMVPGGLGSFDVFMLLGLTQLGVNNNLAAVWLLFYRLFYYVIPFLIGIGFFLQDAGRRLNAELEGLPLQVVRKVAHIVLVVFLYFSAIMLLLRGIIPVSAMKNHVFVRLYPYTFLFLSRVTNIMMAFIIFGFARGIANRVKKAYAPTVIVLLLALAGSLMREYSLRFILFLAVILVAAVFARKELTRDRMDFPWGNRLVDAGIFGMTALFYALALFYNVPNIHHRRPVPQVFLFPSERMWFSTFVGVLVAALTLGVIYHYLSNPKPNLGVDLDVARVKAVLAQYGGNEISHLAFTGDKKLRFYQVDGEDRVFFLYRKKTDKIVILGEPIGDPDQIGPAIADFMAAADSNDLTLVFYEISEQLTMLLHEYGFDFMKFGEEGDVDVTNFSLAGTKRKGERALMHKFERKGYTYQWLKPPFSAETLAALKQVSDSWLEGRPEKGFSLGFFDADYLNTAPVAVIKDQAGQIVSFASAMPMHDGQTTSIDLMRSSEAAPSGIMDGIFINLFQQAQADGYQYFNMGMAPLANVGTSSYSFFEEKLAHLVYQYGYRFYGFQGLRSYKNKYVTKWVPKYVAYRKRNSLLFTLLQILLLVNQRVDQRKEGGYLTRRLAKISRISDLVQRSER